MKKVISMNEALAKGLAKRVIREIVEHEYESLGIDHFPRKKLIREAIKYIKRDRIHVYLGSRFKETSKWEVLYGGWSATKSIDGLEYNKLGFDIDYDLSTGKKTKRIFITLSKHALERLILRKKPYMIKSREVLSYLNSIIKRLVTHCLAFIHYNQLTKCDFSAEIDGLVFAMAFSFGRNQYGFSSLLFMIKTVMPIDYSGAQKLLMEDKGYCVSLSIYPYWNVVSNLCFGSDSNSLC